MAQTEKLKTDAAAVKEAAMGMADAAKEKGKKIGRATSKGARKAYGTVKGDGKRALKGMKAGKPDNMERPGAADITK